MDKAKYLVLALLMYMPLFGHLDTLSIRTWDEARPAVNAYEMLHNGNYLVTYYNGNPDMWNTKPPLLVWIQVLSMKIFGVNELAVRIPSAIAAFMTCIVLLAFSIRYLKNFWFGFIAVLVLITSVGYINEHAARTGDYDALLTLFTTVSGLLFFAFGETKKYSYLYGFFLFTALAVLTKSISGLLFLPAILIYSIIEKQWVPLLRSKHFYFGLFSFLAVVIGYYLLREAFNHGYLAAVRENELGGRYLEVKEDHKDGFWYYIENFMHLRLSAWFVLVPCGILTGFFIKDKKINRLTLFSFLMVITFLLVISFSQTKLNWYDVPLYPFLAILIAVFIYIVFRLLQNLGWANRTFTVNIVPFIFLILIGFTPYQRIFDMTQSPKKYDNNKDFYGLSYYLKDAVAGKHDLSNQYLLYNGYSAPYLFYLNILNDKGVKISFKAWKKLEDEDVVIASQDDVKLYVEENYLYEVIHAEENVVTYKINGRK